MTGMFGGPASPSIEAKGLRRIDSREQPFVNKDFVRNISWLNNSVDTLAGYTEQLQKGVDAANQNFIEQIEAFIADLFIIFAGGEPTGIDFGDLKYIIRGIGALLGINPDTPFPLNLFDAAIHLFIQFIVPAPQFLDVIFDAILAWLEELGFSDECIDAIQGFSDAVVQFYNDVTDILGELGNILKYLFKGLGMGTGWLDLGPLQELWNEVAGLIDQILSGPRQLLLYILSQVLIVIFKILTWVVNFINPRNLLALTGVDFVGPQLAPDDYDKTTVWSIGASPQTAWVFDSTKTHGGSQGCFSTNGTGVTKRLLTQASLPCTPDESYALSGWVFWDGIPIGPNDVGVCVVFYAGANEVAQTNMNLAAGHGSSGGWQQVAADFVVPDDVDNFKIGCRIDNDFTSGSVWIDEISCTMYEPLGMGIANTILEFVDNLFPLHIFADIIGLINPTIEAIVNWFKKLLHIDSSLDAKKLTGTAHVSVFDLIPLESISSTDGQTNYLINPAFEGDPMGDHPDWFTDTEVKHGDDGGSIKTFPDGTPKELYSNTMSVVTGQNVTMSIQVEWEGLVTTSPSSIKLSIAEFDQGIEIASTVLEDVGSTAAQSNWIELNGDYTAADGPKEVAMKFEVTAEATAGTVWFSDGIMSKSAQRNVAPVSWIEGLEDTLFGIDEFIQNVIDIVIEVIDGIPIIGGFLADFLTELNDWWEDTMATAAAAADALGGLIELIENLLLTPAVVIGSIIHVVIDGVGHTVQNFFDILFSAFGGSGTNKNASHVGTQAAVVTSTAASAQSTAAGAQITANSAQSSANNAQFSTETLAGFFNEPRVLPSWLGNLSDDVCFATSLIDGTTAPNLGQLLLIPVRVQQDRLYDAIKLGVDAVDMTYLYVGLYDVDETTGAMTKVIDLGNVKASVNLTYDYQVFPLSVPISVQRGEVYYIGVVQVGGTASALHRWGATNNFVTGFYPRYIGNYWSTGGISALPASLSAAEALSGIKYWGALGTLAAPVSTGSAWYSDSFDRPNTSEDDSAPLGSSWIHGVGPPYMKIYNNTVASPYGTMGLERYKNRMASTNHAVAAQYVAGVTNSYGMCLIARGNGLGKFVYLWINDNIGSTQARIMTSATGSYSSIGSNLQGGTQRASGDQAFVSPVGKYWELVCVANAYIAFQDGVEKFRWTDSGNAFPITSAFTEVGIASAATTWGTGRADNWSARDI